MALLLVGLNVPEYLVILRHKWEQEPEETIHAIETIIRYPCFIKPAKMGSSVGISEARNWDELTQGLVTAAQYDRKIIVETRGGCAKSSAASWGMKRPSPHYRAKSSPGEFYDYDAKYERDDPVIVPADLTSEQVRTIQELAIHAFQAIDCSGMAR